MTYHLFQYDNGEHFGVASDEDITAYTKALQEGRPFITRGYHGYNLKMTVRKVRSVAEEKALFGTGEHTG